MKIDKENNIYNALRKAGYTNKEIMVLVEEPNKRIIKDAGKMIPLKDWDRLCKEADVEMKASNGHEYVTILKTRCQLCGRSPKQKGKCPYWLNSYMHKLYSKVNKWLEK